MSLIGGKRINTVGGCTLERPIGIGVRESSWAARGDGGVPRVVELCERFDDTEDSGDSLGRFFDRGLLQRRVADATGAGPGGLGRQTFHRDHWIAVQLGQSHLGDFLRVVRSLLHTMIELPESRP